MRSAAATSATHWLPGLGGKILDQRNLLVGEWSNFLTEDRDNANDFIKDLTLEYNKMRQASITTELLEIATAQMALGS